MKHLKLTSGNMPSQTIAVKVSNSHFRKLNELRNIGGFTRFQISLIEETKDKAQTDTDTLLPFLYTIFANKPLINAYFL